MSDKEQINAFSKDLWALIDRYRAEFNLSVGGAVGTLQIAAVQLSLTKGQKLAGDAYGDNQED